MLSEEHIINNNQCANSEEMEIDLHDLVRIFRKRLRLIAVLTLLSVICAVAVSFWVLQPVYQAQTLLMVTKATEKLQAVSGNSENRLEDVVGLVSPTQVLTMGTYLGQIKSEALMNRIVKDLDLSYSIRSLAGMIQAEVIKDSNLISVKVNNQDPLLASRIANSLSEQYLQLMTDKNQEQLNRSVVFLEKQLVETDKELQEVVNKMEDFQSQPRGVAVLEAEFNQKTGNAAEYASQLQVARVEVQQLSSGVARLKQELAITPQVLTMEKWNPESGESDSIQEINPLFVSLSQELMTKQAALAEKQGQITGLESLVAKTKTELDQLQADLSSKRLQEEKLQREVDRLSRASETLAQKSMEIQIARSINLGDTTVMVISEASLPTKPIKPNKKLNVAIAAVLGLMLSSLLAFVLEYLDNTIKTPEDVGSQLGVPVLGIIPYATPATVQKGSYRTSQ